MFPMARKAQPKQSPKTSAAKASTPKAPAKDRMIDAALALAAEKPWRQISLTDIAEAADVSLAEAQDAGICRAGLVASVIARHDQAMLASDDPSLKDESRRDRLFDAVMRRLEAMRPHKAALKSMSIGGGDFDSLAAGPRLLSSLAWMLRSAGISVEGPLGFLRVQAMGGVYAATLRQFMRDDSEDLASTMATLDKALKRASRMLGG